MSNKYNCIVCNFHNDNLKDWNRHCNTRKHLKNTGVVTIIKVKNLKCQMCDYCTDKITNLKKHAETKHKITQDVITQVSKYPTLNYLLKEKAGLTGKINANKKKFKNERNNKQKKKINEEYK